MSRPRSSGAWLASAVGVALLAAIVWALLRGVLEVSVGLLALAAVAGWVMGASVRLAGLSAWLAVGLAASAWLLGLLLAWVVAMAILPDSARTFLERLEATPFLDWMAPQFGLLEMAALVLYIAAAAYGARRPPARA